MVRLALLRGIGWTLNAAYLTALASASPWIAWQALRAGKYRHGAAAKLLGRVPRRTSQTPCLWLHAVSVGEVNLAAGVLERFAARHPDWDIVVSSTTKTGYELALRKYADRYRVCYCPLDFSWAVRNALARIRPDLLVLAELELWPNLILAARAAGVPVAIVNGRLSDRSRRGYRRIGWLTAPLLRQIACIAAQDAETARRFGELGARPETVSVTGSLKYDGALTDRRHPRVQALRELAAWPPGAPVLLAGSTQAPEEALIVEIFRALRADHPELRLILVPRHAERFDEVAGLLDASGIAWSRRSQLVGGAEGRAPVLLVDVIGELGAWWGTATAGFVGGSFGNRGGQNMIEPAAFGVATSFGPNTWNFRDIVAHLLAADGARQVASPAELGAFVRRVLEEPEWGAALGERGRRFVASQQGSTARTVELLEQVLSATADSARQAA
jgi:3-deoxy-D-manno-octulosonic-acid transferase